MKLRLPAAALALLVPALSCKAPEKPKPPPNPPSITSFTVDKAAIRKGEMVTFAFTVDRAASVELIDQTGAAVGVTFDDLTGSGSAKATPQRSGFYVLRADGEGGRDAAFVQVAVDEGLQSVFLIVVPQRVKPGERVDLIWSAAGGKNVKLTAGTTELSTMESGATSQTPMTTTTYTLKGDRADGTVSSQSATVTVVPLISEFTATPPAAMPGEKITLAWKTAGAERVVLEEATFGQLVSTTTNVATGTVDFVVPRFFADGGVIDAGTTIPDPDAGTVDGGVDAGEPISNVPVVRPGFPLRFTLTASTATPAQQVQRALDARVGQGPVIDYFDCPGFGSRGKPLTMRWHTTGAARVELRANGLPVYAPLAGSNLSDRFTLGAFTAETTFTLAAFDYNGLEVSASKLVKVVAAPVITEFNVPASAPGTGRVTATWKTQNALFLLLRLKSGPAFFREDGVNAVNMGTTQFTVPLRGTYVLEAYNAAGDFAAEERVIDTSSPVTFSVTPELMARGGRATMQWDVGSLSPTDLVGLMGAPPTVATNPNGFDDLSNAPNARRLFFSDLDDDVATIELPAGFVFPFVTQHARTLTVSTNGFIALGNTQPLSVNQDFSDLAYAGPPMLAPFWDDLDLGTTGRVLWNFDDSVFPRRVTISWHDVARYGEAGTKLTFQVQLFETGKFIFAYKVLDGPGADGTSATIGVVDAPDSYVGLVAFESVTSAELAVDTERVWFSGSNETAGQRDLIVRRHSILGFVVETGQERIPLYGRIRAFGAGDVEINEAMPTPLSSVTAGQWVELVNRTSVDLDLVGLRLENTTSGTNPFTFPNFVLQPAGFGVVGQSTMGSENGDAGVRTAWMAPFALATPDRVRLVLPTPLADGGTLVISQFGWGVVRGSTLPDGGPLVSDAGVSISAGVSVQRADEGVLVAAGATLSCSRSATFGPPGQQGTPGTANEDCFPYALSTIPPAFDDISSIGAQIFTPNSFGEWDESVFPITILPFPYFGTTSTDLQVSTNGWLSFDPAATGSASFNKTVPTSSQPLGTIAPFWDNLANNLTLPFEVSNAFVARRRNHTIIQWNKAEHFFANDQITFEAKLFDNGVIEFHYGQRLSGSTSNYATGNSATVWIDNPLGTAALPASINRAIPPDVAFRFTPRSLLRSTP